MRNKGVLIVLVLGVIALVGGGLLLALGGGGASPPKTGPGPRATAEEGPDEAAPADDAKVKARAKRWTRLGHGEVLGSVREFGTDRPLGGLEVTLAAGVPGPDELLRTTTSADGRFRFESVTNFDAWTLNVAASPPLEALRLAGVDVIENRQTDLGVLYLTPGYSVPGIVVDHRGEPVEGATVSALRSRPQTGGLDFLRLIRELPVPTPSVDSARTDAEGRFALTRVPPGTYDMLVEKQGYESSLERGVIVNPAAAERELRLVVVPGFRLEGRVRRADGGSVEGLTVVAMREPQGGVEDLLNLNRTFATADAEGGFLLEGLGGGKYIVAVTPENEPFAIDDDVQIPAQKFLELVIEGDATLSGKVTDSDGGPIAGAQVYVLSFRGNPVVGNVATDASGRYEMRGLASGPVQLFMVQAEGYGTWPEDFSGLFMSGGSDLVLEPGPNQRDVQLGAGATVRGLVVDQESEEPVEGVRVSVVSPLSFFGGTRGATTDAEGRFELVSVPKGASILLASKEGWYQPGMGPQTMMVAFGAMLGRGGAAADPGSGPTIHVSEAGQVIERTLKIAPGTTVSGRVVTPDGQPVAGARVHTEPSEEGSGFFGQLGAIMPTTEPRLTDSEGRFEMPGPPPLQKSVVVAEAQGWLVGRSEVVSVRPGESATDVEVKLRAGATLEGRVTDLAGKPVADALVRWISSEGGEEWRTEWELRRARPTPTAADGTYLVRNVETGSLLVEATHPSFIALRRGDVAGEEGKTATVDFELDPGRAISGRVLGPDGAPVPGARVSIERADQDQPMRVRFSDDDLSVDAKGAFLEEGLEPGTYRLVARAERYAESPPATVAAGGPPVELRLQQAFDITGFVRCEGRPVANVQVVAVGRTGDGPDAEERQAAESTTGKSGEFTLEDLPAGRYELRVSQGWSPASRANVIPTSVPDVEAGRQGVVIECDPGLVLSGKVVGGSGTVVEGWAWCSQVEVPEGQAPTTANAMIVDGAFELSGLRPGRYQVHVNTGAVQRTLTAEAGRRDLVIDLAGGGTVRGRVVGTDGAGAGGINVHAQSEAGSGGAQTDEQGNFELTGLSAGTYSISAWGMPLEPGTAARTARVSEVVVTDGGVVEGVEMRLAAVPQGGDDQ